MTTRTKLEQWSHVGAYLWQIIKQLKLVLKGWYYTVKLGNKERFDKKQIGVKDPFPVTNLPFTS